MVNTCCVPGCKSGYRSQLKVKVTPPMFGFPKNEELRSAWIKAISRKDWTPTNISRVCAKHFNPDDFVLYSNDSRINRRKARESQILQRTRIKFGAIPKIFPKLPSNLTSKPSVRSDCKTSSVNSNKNTAIKSLNKDFLEMQVRALGNFLIQHCYNKLQCLMLIIGDRGQLTVLPNKTKTTKRQKIRATTEM